MKKKPCESLLPLVLSLVFILSACGDAASTEEKQTSSEKADDGKPVVILAEDVGPTEDGVASGKIGEQQFFLPINFSVGVLG